MREVRVKTAKHNDQKDGHDSGINRELVTGRVMMSPKKGDLVKHRFFALTVIVMAVISLESPPAAAMAQARPSSPGTSKTWTPPKTPSGDPDLQGVWSTTTTAPLERPAQFGERRFLTDEEHAARVRQLENQRETDGQETSANERASTGPPAHWTDRATQVSRQTSLVVEPPDGRVPVIAAAEAKRDYDLAHATDAFEHMSPWDRCITRGMPGGMFPGGYGNVYQIVQAPGYVAILMEMIHETRVIPLDNRPRLNARQWNGDSRGHWEGNTLVVETTNYNNKGWIATNVASGRIKGIPQSEALRVVERFTRVDANTIQYEITIEDPNVYTRPWKVSFPMNLDPKAQLFEYACHEGNHAMTNMLSGARAVEKAAEEAARK